MSSQLPLFSDYGEGSQEYSLIKLKPVPMVSSSNQRLRNETFVEAKVRMRTSEPGKRLKELFLNKQKPEN